MLVRNAGRGESGYDESILRFTEAAARGMFDHLRLPLVNRALEKRGDPAEILARLFAYDDSADLPGERGEKEGWQGTRRNGRRCRDS